MSDFWAARVRGRGGRGMWKVFPPVAEVLILEPALTLGGVFLPGHALASQLRFPIVIFPPILFHSYRTAA